ncbi:hypothetical protein I3843_16G039300 [Carya illinoinensis]|nr:hypothetical protein I3843_16G039300 [Carya illinoinensis]
MRIEPLNDQNQGSEELIVFTWSSLDYLETCYLMLKFLVSLILQCHIYSCPMLKLSSFVNIQVCKTGSQLIVKVVGKTLGKYHFDASSGTPHFSRKSVALCIIVCLFLQSLIKALPFN